MNLYGKILFIILPCFLNHYENNFDKIFKNYFNIKRVSIIIPIFNAENFLKDCLNSAVNQSLNNIEIICIDDGSFDNSSKILEDYSKFDDRFIILKQKNKGPGYSRNKAIKISRGKFISFLDSDDMYYNNFALKCLYEKALKSKAIICGGGIEILKNGKNKTYTIQNLFDKEGFVKYIDYQYDYDYQRFLYNKNFLIKNKLFFPRYLRFQDPPFFIKTMAKAKKFYSIKNITSIFRKTQKKEFNLQQIIDIYSGLNDCLKLAEQNHLYKLYNTTLNRLNMKFLLKEVEKFSENKNLINIIIKLISNINNEIIRKYKLNFILDEFYRNISNDI